MYSEVVQCLTPLLCKLRTDSGLRQKVGELVFLDLGVEDVLLFSCSCDQTLTQLNEEVNFVSWFEGRHGGRRGRCLTTPPL